jgi:hypothetical protein
VVSGADERAIWEHKYIPVHVHVYDVHVHAYDVHAYDVHAYDVHAYDVQVQRTCTYMYMCVCIYAHE